MRHIAALSVMLPSRPTTTCCMQSGISTFMALLGLLRLHAGDKHPERIGKQHIAAAGG